MERFIRRKYADREWAALAPQADRAEGAVPWGEQLSSGYPASKARGAERGEAEEQQDPGTWQQEDAASASGSAPSAEPAIADLLQLEVPEASLFHLQQGQQVGLDVMDQVDQMYLSGAATMPLRLGVLGALSPPELLSPEASAGGMESPMLSTPASWQPGATQLPLPSHEPRHLLRPRSGLQLEAAGGTLSFPCLTGGSQGSAPSGHSPLPAAPRSSRAPSMGGGVSFSQQGPAASTDGQASPRHLQHQLQNHLEQQQQQGGGTIITRELVMEPPPKDLDSMLKVAVQGLDTLGLQDPAAVPWSLKPQQAGRGRPPASGKGPSLSSLKMSGAAR
jgi:hypothetical protein